MGFKERDLRNIDEVLGDDEIIKKRVKRNIEVRVNCGIYAKRKIHVGCSNIRPTLARTKSILFDILFNLVEPGFTMLDAFAGSGAIGIEALSRESTKVVFVDINQKNTRAIEKNLNEMTKLPGKWIVINKSILRPIKGSPIDVVFIDPPYKDSGLIPDVIKKLEVNGWIDERTIIVTETDRRFEVILHENYNLIRDKIISSSILRFYSYNPVVKQEEIIIENDSIID